MELRYITNGMSSPEGKPRVYFSCHPDDFDLAFPLIPEDILRHVNCAVWYDTKTYSAMSTARSGMTQIRPPRRTGGNWKKSWTKCSWWSSLSPPVFSMRKTGPGTQSCPWPWRSICPSCPLCWKTGWAINSATFAPRFRSSPNMPRIPPRLPMKRSWPPFCTLF